VNKLISKIISFFFKKATEDINIHDRPRLKRLLEICDNLFTIIFTAEVVLKLTAYGPKKYFSDGWSCLDFAIVIVKTHIR